jgi:hypothetical protein
LLVPDALLDFALQQVDLPSKRPHVTPRHLSSNCRGWFRDRRDDAIRFWRQLLDLHV